MMKILYEDNELLVINKRSGIAVHGGSGVKSSLLDYFRRTKYGADLKLVHRLDKDTSGLLVLAKRKFALLELSRQLSAGEMFKKYYAYVQTEWPESWTVSQTIKLPLSRNQCLAENKTFVASDGFICLTEMNCLRVGRGWCLVWLKPKTGRTHQLRVHCSSIGLPIIGDKKYGKSGGGKTRLMLHSTKLCLRHPTTRLISTKTLWCTGEL